MIFLEEKDAFEKEVEAHYSSYPTPLPHIDIKLQALLQNYGKTPHALLKAEGYKIIASECPIKIFRHFPFYNEINVGKDRRDLGSAGGLCTWFKNSHFGKNLHADAQKWWSVCHETGISVGWLILDDNHHCGGTDVYLKYGINGLIEKINIRLDATPSPSQTIELKAMKTGLESLVVIANRFALEAENMFLAENEPLIKNRLKMIAKTAKKVPANPPETFYEALCSIIFIREVVQSLEANGISILGHLDRILFPYYEHDIVAGILTREEAKNLLSYFLSFFDARFGMKTAPSWHVGTNTTVVIGGCDENGRPVFNEITKIIAEIYKELHIVDPKLNARISVESPQEYFEILSSLTAVKVNSLCIFNDDVIIPANVKMGKKTEDCRLYVGGGCQENVLENTEVNSRATIYLNLAAVLLMGLDNEKWDDFIRQNNLEICHYRDTDDFNSFYNIFLKNLHTVIATHVAQRNKTECRGMEYNPCPLHSAFINDCIDRGKDMMEGGARYNFGSVSLTGIGTIIDSLFAVKELIYTKKMLSLRKLNEILKTNFEGEETLRQYIINRIPKYGRNEELKSFSQTVFSDIAKASGGMENTRGGCYEASLFSFTTYFSLGSKTGATPDGRKAGAPLSAGMSPSVLALGRSSTAGQILDSIKGIDMTLYPVVAVLDMKLPLSSVNPKSLNYITSVIKRFVISGGSVLQLNNVDNSTLKKARMHPEQYPDIVVRVSGYSAYFSSLSDDLKDEIIARTSINN